MEKYQPSNATEYDDFRAVFCDKCTKDVNEDCPIVLDAMFFDVDDPEYPDAWIILELPSNSDKNRYSATCTEFEEIV
ncbi:MAG: hypothetical protein QNJ60_06085 [Xenococcaceae cyanobacterium MO_188.B19]|nr:hypothetical protein [Xenococcaceae cyanobacterium MO_188.B19]